MVSKNYDPSRDISIPVLITALARKLIACDLCTLREFEGASSENPEVMQIADRVLFNPEGYRQKTTRDDGLRAAWAVYKLLKEEGYIKNKNGKELK